MDKPQTQYVSQMYDRYTVRLLKEDWRITLGEWLAFWGGHPLLEAKIKSPKGIVIYRLSESDPWTIDNIAAATRSDRVRLKKLEDRVPTKHSKKRQLTIEQWLSEIRLNRM